VIVKGIMRKVIGTVLLVGILAAAGNAASSSATTDGGGSGLRVSILFNNVAFAPGLETAWGFAAVIEGLEQTLLFDTGGDGELLLANMARMGIDPGEIDAVFLSHFHSDHTHGLHRFLQRNPNATVFMPATFPSDFQASTRKSGAHVDPIAASRKLFAGAYSSGPMGQAPEEQALILDTDQGLVIVTGCAHPGIVEIVRESTRRHGKAVRLLVGGFHLLRQSERRIRETISELKALGVTQVAPSHCTGDRATALFREAWGEDFLDGGCGAVIEIAP
jgi:7,8-dihydropterin-6-yl-methyl-4-(beta-D-ribofuranosyl)aminobenzene 5'-phosphate synthase